MGELGKQNESRQWDNRQKDLMRQMAFPDATSSRQNRPQDVRSTDYDQKVSVV